MYVYIYIYIYICIYIYIYIYLHQGREVSMFGSARPNSDSTEYEPSPSRRVHHREDCPMAMPRAFSAGDVAETREWPARYASLRARRSTSLSRSALACERGGQCSKTYCAHLGRLRSPRWFRQRKRCRKSTPQHGHMAERIRAWKWGPRAVLRAGMAVVRLLGRKRAITARAHTYTYIYIYIYINMLCVYIYAPLQALRVFGG